MASVQVPISDKVVPRFTHCWVYESMVDIMIYRACSWARYKQSNKVFTKLNSTNIYIYVEGAFTYRMTGFENFYILTCDMCML